MVDLLAEIDLEYNFLLHPCKVYVPDNFKAGSSVCSVIILAHQLVSSVFTFPFLKMFMLCFYCSQTKCSVKREILSDRLLKKSTPKSITDVTESILLKNSM